MQDNVKKMKYRGPFPRHDRNALAKKQIKVYKKAESGAALPNPNKPRLQVVLDCRGEAAQMRHMRLLEAFLGLIRGSEYAAGLMIWITRTDLLEDLEGRGELSSLQMPHWSLAAERFHDPSFDLYESGERVPVGRLINVKIPDWS
jgi:hypothetical protein